MLKNSRSSIRTEGHQPHFPHSMSDRINEIVRQKFTERNRSGFSKSPLSKTLLSQPNSTTSQKTLSSIFQFDSPFFRNVSNAPPPVAAATTTAAMSANKLSISGTPQNPHLTSPNNASISSSSKKNIWMSTLNNSNMYFNENSIHFKTKTDRPYPLRSAWSSSQASSTNLPNERENNSEKKEQRVNEPSNLNLQVTTTTTVGTSRSTSSLRSNPIQQFQQQNDMYMAKNTRVQSSSQSTRVRSNCSGTCCSESLLSARVEQLEELLRRQTKTSEEYRLQIIRLKEELLSQVSVEGMVRLFEEAMIASVDERIDVMSQLRSLQSRIESDVNERLLDRDRITDLEAENARLIEQIAKTINASSSAFTSVPAAPAVTQLNNQQQKQSQRIEELEDEVMTLSMESQQKNEAILAAKQSLREVREELQKAQEKFKISESQASIETQRVREELSISIELLEKSRKKEGIMKQYTDKMDGVVQELQKQLIELREEIKSKNALVTSLSGFVEQNQILVQSARDEGDRIAQQNHQLSSQLEEKMSEIAYMQEKSNYFSQQLISLCKKLDLIDGDDEAIPQEEYVTLVQEMGARIDELVRLASTRS